MKSSYKLLGPYIREVNLRNIEGKEENLLGVSTNKIFIQSIANTVGTNFKKYKIVNHHQFTYVPDTSRRGDRIGIALLEDYQEGLVSSAYTVFEITNHEELLPEYLMMWFRRPEFDRYARFNSHGSVREMFDWEEMCNVELPVPEIEKQKAIVKEYNTIANRIKLNEELNKKLEETAQAIYKQWFVDFEFPDENGKPYKSSGGEIVLCEELGKDIPKGWELLKLENLVRYNYASHNKNKDKFESILYLDTSNITNNKIDEIKTLTVGLDIIPSRAKRKIVHNDIIYSTIRPNLKHYGIIKNPTKNMLVSTGFMVIQSKKKNISNEFLYLWLSKSEVTDFLQSKAEMSVSTYPSIKPEDILDIDILIPNDNVILKKINLILSDIFTIQWILNCEGKPLLQMKFLLLSKMSKG